LPTNSTFGTYASAQEDETRYTSSGGSQGGSIPTQGLSQHQKTTAAESYTSLRSPSPMAVQRVNTTDYRDDNVDESEPMELRSVGDTESGNGYS